jgi:NAD(P)H-flavin reductase
LQGSQIAPPSPQDKPVLKAGAPGAISAVVEAIEQHTMDTFTIRVKHAERVEMGPGQHVRIANPASIGIGASSSQQSSGRPYTPVRVDRDARVMWFLVRRYETGSVSKALTDLRAGAALSMAGPFEHFSPASELVVFSQKSGIISKYTRLLFVAGGTGIAPLFSILTQFVFNDERPQQRSSNNDGLDSGNGGNVDSPGDAGKTSVVTEFRDPFRSQSPPIDVVVITANHTPADIMLEKELARLSPPATIIHTVSRCPPEEETLLPSESPSTQSTTESSEPAWPRVGRLASQDLDPYLGDGTFAVVCGPPGFSEAIEGLLAQRVPCFVFPER